MKIAMLLKLLINEYRMYMAELLFWPMMWLAPKSHKHHDDLMKFIIDYTKKCKTFNSTIKKIEGGE